MLNQAPGIISFRMLSRISLHYVLGPSMPTFFCIPTTQLNLIISKNNEKDVLPTDSFLSSLSRVKKKRGLCWKGLDCHLGKKPFGTPLGCVGTKDSRISMDVSENSGTPKSSILIGFSIINKPFWGPTPIFWFNTHIYGYLISHCPKFFWGPGLTMEIIFFFFHPQVFGTKIILLGSDLMIFKLPVDLLWCFVNLDPLWNLSKRETWNG